jgi:hypothetical protein
MIMIRFATWILAALTLSNTVHAQTCPKSNRIAPDSRYELQNDGAEVLDKKTKLVWQRCSLGQVWDNKSCTGTATKYSWKQALEAAKISTGDWSVPDAHELRSLLEPSCNNPAINLNIFPDTPGVGFWSSTSLKRNNNKAWNVYFNNGNGYFDGKDDRYSVRLVHRQKKIKAKP